VSFKKALIYDPKNEETRQLVRQLEVNLTIAEQTILRKLENNPDNSVLHKQLGKIYQAQSLYNNAIEQYERVLSQNPESIEAVYDLATLYADQGQYPTAIAYMKQTIVLQPENPAHDYNIACLYAIQKMPVAAMSYLKKALGKGYTNWNLIRTDDDLQSIRETEEFKQLIRNR